ncbi:DUF975 family protein [Cohnella herbarum]|uniref:DUF975 family protein n=1 Tax=Cohnella herbarum TaxID=2728023 RepID=A0A7Z2VSG1_9BACL|nr:DUF975 family protein [Cohnella herbarum]
MPTSAEIRARARASLAGNWTSAVLHFLLYYVVIWALGLLAYIPIIGWIAIILVTGALTYGLFSFYLTMSRNQAPSTGELFSGFEKFVPTFILYIVMCIFIFLWSLLLIVPGIIAAIRYSQAYYILRDNPNIGALEAIQRSKELMEGNKGRYFVLYLSFIGWYILGIISCGIGLLWVAPYFYTALGHFHDDLRGRYMSYSSPPPPPSPYGGQQFN